MLNSAAVLYAITRYLNDKQNAKQVDKWNNTPRDCRWRYIREGYISSRFPMPNFPLGNSEPVDLVLSALFSGIFKESRNSRGSYLRQFTYGTNPYTRPRPQLSGSYRSPEWRFTGWIVGRLAESYFRDTSFLRNGSPNSARRCR